MVLGFAVPFQEMAGSGDSEILAKGSGQSFHFASGYPSCVQEKARQMAFQDLMLAYFANMSRLDPGTLALSVER